MPPKVKYQKDEMINAAVEIVRDKGISALTARELAAFLGVSTRPIFTYFDTMEQLKAEVYAYAKELYREYVLRGLEAPIPNLGVGQQYLRFAKNEPELYKYLFLSPPDGVKGGAVEVLLLRDLGNKRWECLCKPGRKMQVGNEVIFGNGELTATVAEVLEDGNRIVEFHYEGIFLEVLERLGKMPLPPYIKEELENQERYQTVYSREVGSAAAPTAGLHFTNELLDQIRVKGVKTAFVTLHVGLGTFRPVKAEDINDHHMHSELCMISEKTAAVLNETKASGGRIICVGTTSCRTLESLVCEDGHFEAKSKWTEIFIYPGYTFKAMDGLITNFHLPESTLVMLVSAFAGRENVLAAYEEAVQEKYRFFSFGDAMCIL